MKPIVQNRPKHDVSCEFLIIQTNKKLFLIFFSIIKYFFFEVTLKILLTNFCHFTNSQAVKRSRVKSKQRTQETMGRVNELRQKNVVLEDRIKQLRKDLKFLKELFLTHATAKSDKLHNIDLNKLLADDDSDMDEPESSNEASTSPK